MKKFVPLTLAIIVAFVSTVAFADAAVTPAPAGVVNLNSADAAQLALLPGIGVKAAQRIVDYRSQNGPFRKTSDLMQVKGVGAKSFERLSPYIVLEGRTTLTAKIHMPRKPRTKKTATTASN
ncbi:MAG: ComEA family DNA-binding protein [Acidobacteria bacterium]|nr:ComEA family DNA-binding protein [Acidobacteriota bacterium]MBV9474687.1 ComEA family DNA-binding protein [Acidobacteriota bacterium]